MPVATEIQAFLDRFGTDADLEPAAGWDGTRRWFDGLSRTWDCEHPPLCSVGDHVIPGPAGDLPVRIYTPVGDGPFPVLLFLHGGGFTVGSLDSHDGLCRELAARASWLVISLDYRLAPEHPYPAAVDDAYAALEWIRAHAAEVGGNPTILAVGGDSAGGNLAAVTTLRARDSNGAAIRFQILLYRAWIPPAIPGPCMRTPRVTSPKRTASGECG